MNARSAEGRSLGASASRGQVPSGGVNGGTIRRRLAGVAVLLSLLAAGAAVVGVSAGWERTGNLPVYGDAPAFGLIDHQGRPVTSDQLRGRVVVANFIYTTCTDTCPLLSQRMQALQERLRREQLLGTRVHLLSFSVDPVRDTPEVLRAYAARHQADGEAWRFVTGPERYVNQVVVQGFRLGAQAVPLPGAGQGSQDRQGGQGSEATRYDVMHSNRFVLIDPQGRIRAYYDGLELDLDRVVRDARHLLR